MGTSVQIGELDKESEQTDAQEKKDKETAGQQLIEMQNIRRRASIIGLQKKLVGESGRKLSNVDKTKLVVSEAIKLAAQEEEKDMGLEELFSSELPEEKELEIPTIQSY